METKIKKIPSEELETRIKNGRIISKEDLYKQIQSSKAPKAAKNKIN